MIILMPSMVLKALIRALFKDAERTLAILVSSYLTVKMASCLELCSLS